MPPRKTNPQNTTGARLEDDAEAKRLEEAVQAANQAQAEKLAEKRKGEIVNLTTTGNLTDGGTYPDEPIDYSVDEDWEDESLSEIVVDPQDAEPESGLSMTSFEVGEPEVVIRVNTDLKQVTIGVGNEYDFERGKRYRVPRHVALHLEERGYVYH